MKKPFLTCLQNLLKKIRIRCYKYFMKLMDISDSFSKDWNFSKSSGWMLKVHNKRKALFYIIPMRNDFKVSMAIRKNELSKFLKDVELKNIHNNLLSAKKYSEGFAVDSKVTMKIMKHLSCSLGN